MSNELPGRIMEKRGIRYFLYIFSILIISAGIFFLFYWDIREWGGTSCTKITCFIKELIIFMKNAV